MTGLEDFVESDALDIHVSNNNREPSSTSSFVQKLLYEDACAGLAVMDLFVAIRAVKENLDILEERNNDFFEKIHDLNIETKVFMKEYEHLRYCITEFLEQMEGDIKIREVMKANRKRERMKEILRKKSTDDTVSKKSKECRDSVEHPASESKLKGIPPCSKEKPPVLTTAVLPEAMMVSFLAALVCLEKEQKRNSFMAGSNKGGKGKPDGTHQQESHKPPEGEVSNLPSQKIVATVNVNKKSSEGDAKSLNSKTDSFSQKEEPSTRIEDEALKIPGTSDNAATSDDEDVFREAVSSVATAASSLDKIEKTSVTFMGDLNKEFMDIKNESFIFKADIDPTKVWRLATDICSKVIKTKRKKKEKVLQQHRQSQQGSSSKTIVADSLRFTVSTNSPMGIFDVTVVPHKKRRLLSKKLDSDCTDSDMTSSPAFTECSTSSIHSPTETWDPEAKKSEQPPKTEVQIKEDHWTNKNLKYETNSISDEELAETFEDAYVEQTKLDDVMKEKTSEKGRMQQFRYFFENPSFFEIHKCHPVYYSQCFTKKAFEEQDHCQVDVSYMDKNSSDEASISLSPGETEENTMVIGGQSSDVVIYIQVELEDESRTISEESVEYQANSLGTQTAEIIVPNERKIFSEKSIKLDENIQEGKSLFKIWKCAREAEEEKNSVNSVNEMNKTSSNFPVKLVVPEKMTAADPEILDFFEVMSEKEIKETRPKEIKSAETVSKMNLVNILTAKQKANVWFVQNNLTPVHRGEIRIRTFPSSPMDDIFDSKGISGLDTKEVSGFEFNLKSVELEDAMKLIHEIESDVAEVKLNDALSILPRLETELRKHVKEKLKNLQQIESKTEGARRKIRIDSTKDSKSEVSQGRLPSLLAIISSLEDAVKLNGNSNIKPKVCGYNSSTIFELLHALTDSIRQVEETPTVTNMSRTIDLASQLDIAVRGEEREIKPSVKYFLPEPKQGERQPVAAEISEQNLKGTRKRILQKVEDEAAVVEDRLERDFERLDRLERENDELLMFLEAFLQKTGRRVSEFGDLKDKLKNLSSSLNDIYGTLKNILSLKEEERKNRMEAVKRIAAVKKRNTKASSQNPGEISPEQSFHKPLSSAPSSFFPPSRPLSPTEPTTRPSSVEASPFISSPNSATPSSTKYPTWEPIKETASGLLQALNTLKSKAVEKKQFYMNILNHKESATSREHNNETQQSSISTFSTKQSEQLSAKIKKFRKIDGHSCYLAWSKPKGLLEDHIEGYHVYVNGKINHRVRNPERCQAVLYSVDFKHKADIQLYAITQKFPKILLATYTLQND